MGRRGYQVLEVGRLDGAVVGLGDAVGVLHQLEVVGQAVQMQSVVVGEGQSQRHGVHAVAEESGVCLVGLLGEYAEGGQESQVFFGDSEETEAAERAVPEVHQSPSKPVALIQDGPTRLDETGVKHPGQESVVVLPVIHDAFVTVW